MMPNLEKPENGGMMGMFVFYEEYLGGRRFYIARCRNCGAKFYESRRKALRSAVKRHRCGADEGEELEAVV